MIFVNRFFIFIFFFLIHSNAIANESDTIIEIDQPRFSEKGLDQKSYEIKAQKGLRSSKKLVLFDVDVIDDEVDDLGIEEENTENIHE